MKPRYDSYKPSGIDWIGEIPSHWKIAPIKYSFRIISGATPKTEKPEYWYGDINWITPADYKTDDHYVKHGRKNITLEGLLSCATEIVPKNSVIFSKRAPIGTVALAAVALCTNQGCISCVPNAQTNSNYFYYLCRIATCEFEILGSGATFLEISSSNFANFPMPLPPLSEQEAIATWLDKKCGEIDSAIAKVDREIKLIDELKQSEISRVVTRGLNPNAPLRPSGIDWIGDVPEHWVIESGKYLLIILPGFPADSNLFVAEEEGFPLIRIRDIDSSNTEIRYTGIVPETHIIHKGDMLVSMDGDFNVAKWKGPDGLLNQRVCKITGSPNYLSQYAYYVLPKLLKRINDVTYATTVKHLSTYDIANSKLPVPPLTEQQSIADYLDKKCAEIDGLKEKLIKKRKTLKELRQAIISEVVTGKRKVI